MPNSETTNEVARLELENIRKKIAGHQSGLKLLSAGVLIAACVGIPYYIQNYRKLGDSGFFLILASLVGMIAWIYRKSPESFPEIVALNFRSKTEDRQYEAKREQVDKVGTVFLILSLVLPAAMIPALFLGIPLASAYPIGPFPAYGYACLLALAGTATCSLLSNYWRLKGRAKCLLYFTSGDVHILNRSGRVIESRPMSGLTISFIEKRIAIASGFDASGEIAEYFYRLSHQRFPELQLSVVDESDHRKFLATLKANRIQPMESTSSASTG